MLTGVMPLIWLCVVSIVTVVAASASIWATIEDRRDIGTGHPSFESLASYTGNWSRDTFIRILGEPDKSECFALPHDKIHELPISWSSRIFDSPFADILSIILAATSPFLWMKSGTAAFVVVSIAAGIQAIGYTIATIVTYRSGIWRKWLQDPKP